MFSGLFAWMPCTHAKRNSIPRSPCKETIATLPDSLTSPCEGERSRSDREGSSARGCSRRRRCVRSRDVLWSWEVSGFRWTFFPGLVWGRSPVHSWRSCFSFFRFFQVFSVWLRKIWSVVVRICSDLCGLGRTGSPGCRAVRWGCRVFEGVPGCGWSWG